MTFSNRPRTKNDLFLILVQDGLTREELQENITRRPHLWEPFSHWLGRLPSGLGAGEGPRNLSSAALLPGGPHDIS